MLGKMGPVLLLAAWLLVACGGRVPGPTKLHVDPDAPLVLAGVADVEEVAQLTGPDSMNRTDRFAVAGTDLGSMFNTDGTTYFVFGDTFGYRRAGMTGGGGGDWRSNVMAVTTDADPADGITFDRFITDASGRAVELIPAQRRDGVEITRIPTHGVAVGTSIYLYFMSVNHWGPPGVWEANYSGVVTSSGGGQTWEELPDLRWDGDSNFIQVSPAKIEAEDGSVEIYFWSIPAGRFGGVALMKVPEASIEDLGSYRYFAGTDAGGTPIWSADMDDAAIIVDDTVGELSVIWNPYLDRWIMTYLGREANMVIREGIQPWGPWGDAITVITQASDPGIYAPYMNPRYVENRGEIVYFCLSRWGPYNVFWMRMRLVRS